MKNTVNIELQQSVAQCKGEIDFLNADQWYRCLNHMLEDHDELAIDLKDVAHADSSALALMTTLQRQAEHLQKTLKFVNVSDNLRSVASTCGMAEWLNKA